MHCKNSSAAKVTAYPTMPLVKMSWRETIATTSEQVPSTYVMIIKLSFEHIESAREALPAAAKNKLVPLATNT